MLCRSYITLYSPCLIYSPWVRLSPTWLDWRSFIFSVCKVDLCVKEFFHHLDTIVRWARQTNSSERFISDNTFGVNEFHCLEGYNVFIAALCMWYFGLIGLQHWSLSVLILLMFVTVILSPGVFTRLLGEQVRGAVKSCQPSSVCLKTKLDNTQF